MKLKHSLSIGFLIVILIESVRCADLMLVGNSGNVEFESELHAPNPQTWKVYWGSETNEAKAGLSIGYYSSQAFQYFSSSPNSIPIRCFPLLYDNSTNNSQLPIFDLPSVKSRYRMELTDEKGNKLQKTEQGVALGKIAPIPYKSSPAPLTGVSTGNGWRATMRTLLPKQAQSLQPPFLLQDYFKITNSGIYHLHFEMCAFRLDPNDMDKEELIHFPPIDAEIEIKLDN
jgi:hypothetical protein